MPSLWKKQKGSRISRLVVDLPKSPKRHETRHETTLIVENPASRIDIFGKNKDKPFRSSKKKQRSKKHDTTTTTTMIMDEYNYPFSIPHTMASKYVPDESKLEVPVDKIRDDVVDDKIYDDDIELSSKKHNASKNYCLFTVMDIFLLCLLMIVMVFGMVTKNHITLTTTFLLSLEYMVNSRFPLFKKNEGVLFLTILKGTSIVVVALYAKGTIMEILMGVFVLLLIQLVRTIITRFDKIGQDKIDELINQPKFEQGDIDVVLSKEEDDMHSKREDDGENNVLITNATGKEVGDDEGIGKDGSKSCSNAKIKKVNTERVLASDDEKVWHEIVSEIESHGHTYSIWPRQNQPIDGNLNGYCEQIEHGESTSKGLTTTNIDECPNNINQSEKVKKRRKFWKKLVPKHMRKSKKNKRGNESDCLEESATELEDNEMEEMADSSSISSDDNNDTEEYYTVVNYNYNETAIDDTKNTFKMSNGNDKIVKGVIVIMIPLVGLISGRVLAFVLTVIGCAMFSIFKD